MLCGSISGTQLCFTRTAPVGRTHLRLKRRRGKREKMKKNMGMGHGRWEEGKTRHDRPLWLRGGAIAKKCNKSLEKDPLHNLHVVHQQCSA